MADTVEHLRFNDRAYLLVRNPGSVLVCWTWCAASAAAFGAQVYEPEITVRLTAADDKNITAECSAPWNACKLYMRPPVEGRIYSAAVYARKKGCGPEELFTSNSALTPVSSSGSGLSSGYASAEFFRKEPA